MKAWIWPAAVLVALAACSPASAATGVAVFPIAGSRTASPETQIAFRGVPAAGLGPITVTGSRSGRHTGTVRGDSDGGGASFLPATGFTPGETVTVGTSLDIVGAGRGSYRFTVARPARPIPYNAVKPAPRVSGDVGSFHSRPDLKPATVRVTRRSASAAPGDIFIGPQLGPIRNGPELLDADGNLIWYRPLRPNTWVSDFRVQSYGGRPVLTWWQGNETAGTGRGEGIIDNAAYRQIAAVKAANGLSADLHEFQLTSRGTALITSFYPVLWNTTAFRHGSKRAIVLDGVVQEIDIKTGLVEYQWDSLDHVALRDSVDPYPRASRIPFDFFHINSIHEAPDGSLVISARNTSTIYDIDHRTGRIVWRIGGPHSSFTLGRGVAFVRQHDARLSSGGLLSLFDDGGGPPRAHQTSRGLLLRVDTRRHTVGVVRTLNHSPGLTANYEGNTQPLPNGDDFIGWGQQPYFTEFDGRGAEIFDARFVGANNTYRAYRFPWTGAPQRPPSAAVTATASAMTVYTSWNGATAVVAWRVLAGGTPSTLVARRVVRKGTFETSARIAGRQPYVQVQALDGAGRVLGASAVIPVP